MGYIPRRATTPGDCSFSCLHGFVCAVAFPPVVLTMGK